MTPEQAAAFVCAQATMARIELEGMVALNTYRTARGETIAYDDAAFEALRKEYLPAIGHSEALEIFKKANHD